MYPPTSSRSIPAADHTPPRNFDLQDALLDICATISLLLRLPYATIADNTALCTYIMQESIIKTIKTVHPYAISPYRNGWATKVNDPASPKKDKRRLITARTQEEIYIRLAQWYGAENLDNWTLDDLYQHWIAYRRKTVGNPNTVQRDEQHYRRYFEGTAFFKEKFRALKRPALKEYCCAVIRGETTRDRSRGRKANPSGPALTRKEWNNAKSILNGMYNWAVDNEYLPTNPLTNMQYPKGLFNIPPKKTKETQIYNSQEAMDLESWCEAKYAETDDTAYPLPVLSLAIGTRIGETVALRWEDWLDERHLAIRREEFLDRTTRKVHVVEHTKTHYDRVILLPGKAVNCLRRIRLGSPADSEWIFTRDGERLRERQGNYILEKYAKAQGIATKSSHKLRKTCGSNLHKGGLSPKQGSDYLGNSPEVFLRNYCYDTDTETELLAKIDKAIGV